MDDAKKVEQLNRHIEALRQNLRELAGMNEPETRTPFWIAAWLRTLCMTSEERQAQINEGAQ